MKPKNFIVSVVWILSISLSIGGCGSGQEQPSAQATQEGLTSLPYLRIQPGDSLFFIKAGPGNDNLSSPESADDTPIKAFSFIEPGQPLDSIKTYRQGKLIHLSLDENLTITARINRNQPIGDTIRTLTGPILDPYTGSVILSIGEEAVTGSVDLISENRLFYIRYDRSSGRHYLAEIDRSKLDVLEGSEPLEY